MKPADTKFEFLAGLPATQYFVPIWQRPYSWTKIEWEDLWLDLINLNTLTQNGGIHEHFIGSMVLKKTQTVLTVDSRLAIVDGQQRFTTLLILYSVIRDIAKELENEGLYKGINNGFLFFESKKDGKPRPRLILQDPDNKELRNIINQHLSNVSPDSSLKKAYDYFYAKLKKKEPELRTFNSLIGSLKLITIELEENDDPHRIFETLNTRGRDLTQADLVRNFFVMRMKSVTDQEEIYKNYWKPMEELLTEKREFETNLNDFFTDFARMLKRSFVRDDDVYEVIKTHFGTEKNTQDMIADMQLIQSYAIVYSKLLFPDKEEDQDILKKLRSIKVSKIYTCYPFLLKTLYETKFTHELTREDSLTVLSYIESYIYRRIYCGLPTNSLNRFFPALCRFAPKGLEEAIRNELLEQSDNLEWPNITDFETQSMSSQIYKSNKEVAKQTLRLLEENHSDYEPLLFDDLEIEHVLPGKLNAEWSGYLGLKAEEIHSKYANTIGNLTLITHPPNASIGQKLFQKKVEEWYGHSGVKLTADIVKNHTEWKEEDIIRRSRELVSKIVKVWRRPDDNEVLEAESKDDKGTTDPN